MARFLVLFFLITQTQRIRCSLVEIYRGKQDEYSIKSDESNQITSKTCPTNRSTYMYSDSVSGQCVSDMDIIANRSEGKWLPEDNGCLGVNESNQIGKFNCNDVNDKFSIRWIWLEGNYILNLKTLKCLEAEKSSGKVKLRLSQCRKNNNNNNQKWHLDEEKNKTIRFKNLQVNNMKDWIKTGDYRGSYFTEENVQQFSRKYQGCYRFSDGKMMRLIDESKVCDTNSKGRCAVHLNIRAPILYDEKITCKLDSEETAYTSDGYKWTKFWNPSFFSLTNKSKTELKLTIQDRKELLKNCSGRLIKVGITCKLPSASNAEHHCILLKIAGSPRNHMTETSTTPIAGSSSSSKSILIAIPIFVLLCLLMVVIAIVLFRRRKRSTANQSATLYEENKSVNSGPQQNPDNPGDAHIYQTAGEDLNAGSGYECPVQEIKDENPGRPPQDKQTFGYDYATRENTALIPLILRGDITFEDESGSESPTKQNDSDPKVAEASSGKAEGGNDGGSGGQPEYHTLEDPDPERNDVEGPYYHSLENEAERDKKETDNAPKSSHVYNVLEAPKS